MVFLIVVVVVGAEFLELDLQRRNGHGMRRNIAAAAAAFQQRMLLAASLCDFLALLSDRSPHRTARLAPRILAPKVMAHHGSTAQAMLHGTRRIFAMRNVFPQSLHHGAVRCVGTFPGGLGVVLALGRMVKQQQALLFVP